MKYLIQNPKEFAITAAAFVMAVINLIRALRSGEIDEDIIITVILTAVGILAWYYNMPTSAVNCRATGWMRMMKKQEQGLFDGESFLDEPEDVEGGEEE